MEGKVVTIINRSEIVGRPLGALLANDGGLLVGWMDGWRWMDMDGWMDGWMDGEVPSPSFPPSPLLGPTLNRRRCNTTAISTNRRGHLLGGHRLHLPLPPRTAPEDGGHARERRAPERRHRLRCVRAFAFHFHFHSYSCGLVWFGLLWVELDTQRMYVPLLVSVGSTSSPPLPPHTSIAPIPAGVPVKSYKLPTEWVKPGAIVVNVASYKNVNEEELMKVPGVKFVPLVGKVTIAMLERNLVRLFDNYHAKDAPGRDFRYYIENRFVKHNANGSGEAGASSSSTSSS
jgi:hypothetical protein